MGSLCQEGRTNGYGRRKEERGTDSNHRNRIVFLRSGRSTVKTKVEFLWANMVGSFFHEEGSRVRNRTQKRAEGACICVSEGVGV